MAAKWNVLAGMFAMIVVCVDSASAAEAPKAPAHENRGVAERLSDAAENVGKKIEEAVTGVAKKFEEQRV